MGFCTGCCNLKALRLQPVSEIIDMNSISLLNNIMNVNSAARKFYFIMLKKKCECKLLLHNRLCVMKKYNFVQILGNKTYVKQ